MTSRRWSRRVRADRKSVAADGNIQDSRISSDSHVTHINAVHIHPASGATVEGASLPDIATILADLTDRTAELAAEQIAQAKRLAALEHRQTTGPTTALADLRQHNAELTSRLETQAERLRAVEDRLEDRQALSSATALTDLQHRNAELTAQFATQADQLTALERQRDAAYASAAASEAEHRDERLRREAAEAERLRADQESAAARARADQYAAERDEAHRRLAAQPPREEGEPVAALSRTQQSPAAAGHQGGYAPGRVLKRRHTVRPSHRGLQRTHFTYKKVGGMKLIVAMKTCSSRWCPRCFRERHGKTLAAVIGPVGLLASLAAAIGLFRVGAPWWIGLPVVLGLFCATPLLVDWAEQSTPKL
ncbi:putative coiled-coil protein SlyX [Streptomyces sp. SAI-144]|uniref:hypothetical protein n=1 Tax=Streptomyces sp. SAI-144 TaxID=2940544 RepID=UPI002476ED8D|nr:hypothetical protein [Streptomyces sp. SAI-144]MDH6440865.1 putative coiled-coil protein SlyX [Streptomyces sp. SAI-144]